MANKFIPYKQVAEELLADIHKTAAEHNISPVDLANALSRRWFAGPAPCGAYNHYELGATREGCPHCRTIH